MARKSTTTGDIVKLKVTLTGIRPPVWRRLLLPAGMTLGDLHDAIQSSMGWENAHLHDFDVDGRRYGDPGTTDEVINEERLTLAEIHRTGIERFKYTYDFGDDWVHLITIEGTIPTVAGQRYPACIAGKRSCPPEDCGGPYRLCPLPRGEKRSVPPRSCGNVELGGTRTSTPTGFPSWRPMRPLRPAGTRHPLNVDHLRGERPAIAVGPCCAASVRQAWARATVAARPGHPGGSPRHPGRHCSPRA